MSQGSYNFSGALPLAPFPYLEVAWLCAPNAAGQSISANSPTTLTLTDIIRALGGIWSGISVTSNQLTGVPAGRYSYEALVRFCDDAASGNSSYILSLFNVTDSSIISNGGDGVWDYYGGLCTLRGQFELANPKTLDLRILAGRSTVVHNKYGSASTAFTLSTAGLDQRTTLKLQKIG